MRFRSAGSPRPTIVGDLAARLLTVLGVLTIAQPAAAIVTIGINDAVAAGGVATVEVSLDTGGDSVGGLQNDILFDSRVVSLASASQCVVNPAIGTTQPGCTQNPVSGPCKTLSRNLASCGTVPTPPGCDGQPSYISRFRGIVASTAIPSTNSIPDGSLLYSCNFTVVDAGGLPTTLLDAGVVASTPTGTRLDSQGRDGVISTGATPGPSITSVPTVTPLPTLTPAPTVTPGGGGVVTLSIFGGEVFGGRATIEVVVDDGGRDFGGAQNDILFDSRVVSLPNASVCRINPAIGTSEPGCQENPVAGPCKTLSRQLVSCAETPTPPGCEGQPAFVSRFRGIVAATAVPNINPIPSGSVLYSCDFDVIDPTQLPTVLSNFHVVAASPLGTRLDAQGLNGTITGPGGCCQCDESCMEPSAGGDCGPCVLIEGSSCTSGVCVSHTPWATATPTRTFTPTATDGPPGAINIAIVPGPVVGGLVNAAVKLEGDGVGGMQNDILFDTRAVTLNNAAACTINPEIGTFNPECEQDPVAGPCKTLSRNLVSCGASPTPPGCEGQPPYVSRFRGIVVATLVPNTNYIPNGSVLYTCNFNAIVENLPTTLVNSNVVASSPTGTRLDAGGTDGVIYPPGGVTYTPTPSRTPTPALTGVDVRILDSQAGNGHAAVNVIVETGGQEVGGMQNDILFDSRIVDLTAASSCVINPEIGTSQAGCSANPVVGPCKTLSRNLASCGANPTPPGCEGQPAYISRFRGIVAATAVPNNNPIPDGALLYSCDFTVVDAGALPTVLHNLNVVASNPTGTRLDAHGTDGTIEPPNGCCQCGFACGPPPMPGQCGDCDFVPDATCDVLFGTCVTPSPQPTPTATLTSTPTVTPSPTRTAGANDCCQCPLPACGPVIGGACGSGCVPIYGAACGQAGLCVGLTPTPTTTASRTATRSPTGSPTFTRTPSLTPPPTATFPPGAVKLIFSKSAGFVGGPACVSVAFESGAQPARKVDVHLVRSNQILGFEGCELGRPGQIEVSTLAGGDVRVVQTSASDLTDGPLFTCIVRIAPTAPLGTEPLQVGAAAFAPDMSSLVPVALVGGQLTVTGCNGDCDGDGTVVIGEVVKSLNTFGGFPLCNAVEPLRSCATADSDQNGSVEIGEVIQALIRFGSSCQ